MALRAYVALVIELLQSRVSSQSPVRCSSHTFRRPESMILCISATLHFTTLQKC